MDSQSLYEAGPTYSSFYETQYMYQQHQQTLPSPPTSPQFSWQVTTIDEDAHTHTYNDKVPSAKARRTQIPAETMSSLMTGPDPIDGKFVCLYGGCMRRFGRKYNIQSHIQTHLADRPFRCNVCAAGFVRRHDLVRHARIHGTSKDFICGCGKGFSRMDALNRHRQRQICVGGAAGKSDGGAKRHMSSPSTRSNRSRKTRSSPESEDRDNSSYRDSSDSASPEPDMFSMTQPPAASFNVSRTHGMQQQQLDAPATFVQYLDDQPIYGKSMSGAYNQVMVRQQPLQYDLDGDDNLDAPHLRQQQHQQAGNQTPRYVAPIARYPVGLDTSPSRVLEQELWVNPSLISPAMTNSSQFHSEGEEEQYYY